MFSPARQRVSCLFSWLPFWIPLKRRESLQKGWTFLPSAQLALAGRLCCNGPSKPGRHCHDHVPPPCHIQVLPRCPGSRLCSPMLHCSLSQVAPKFSCSALQGNQPVSPKHAASRALSLFSLCKSWQGEKALLTVWQREEVNVSGIGKQELSQRAAHLERKKNFQSVLVLEGFG